MSGLTRQFLAPAAALVLTLSNGLACSSSGSSTPSPAAKASSSPAGLSVSGNLIVNGDAEAGSGSPSAEVVPVPGWTSSGQFTAVEYDTPGTSYLQTADPGPPRRGHNYFGGGPSSAVSAGEQLVDIGARAAAIDTGKTTFALDGWLGGWSDQEDNAVLGITFLDAGGTELGNAAIGPVTSADRGGKTGLVERQASGMVPKQARKVRVTLTLTRAAGAFDDGYADDLSLTLTG